MSDRAVSASADATLWHLRRRRDFLTETIRATRDELKGMPSGDPRRSMKEAAIDSYRSALDEVNRSLSANLPSLDGFTVVDEQQLAREREEAVRAAEQARLAALADMLAERLRREAPRKTTKNPPVQPIEADIRVRDYLKANPNASQRQVAKATGVPKSTVGTTPAWRVHQEAKRAANPEPAPGRSPKTRPLTPGMLAVRSGGDSDPADEVVEFDALEARYLNANPAAKGIYFAKSKEAKESLVYDWAADQPD
jgi:hypothetical protein